MGKYIILKLDLKMHTYKCSFQKYICLSASYPEILNFEGKKHFKIVYHLSLLFLKGYFEVDKTSLKVNSKSYKWQESVAMTFR